jgi:phosphoribosyl 1,2-cyclic phosphodiesterase
MRVHFWGVRGSVPYATPGSIGHGCNTPCLEVVDEHSGRRLILDAGSGIVGVGNALNGVADIPIVLTHYHWDHVQGLPFFAPLYRSGTAVTVWAPMLGREFGDIEAMFEAPFFPVPYDRLPSRPAIQMNAGGRVEINGFDVSTQLLNHPGGSFAYRIKSGNGDVVCATDHEFGNADIDLALAHFAVGAHA